LKIKVIQGIFKQNIKPKWQIKWEDLMEAGGLAPLNLIQPTISLEMPVPSQGHCGFPCFPVVD
jgi:hypothetical protein